MTATAKITKVGNSSAIIIPKDIMDRLHLGQGDLLSITQTQKGIEVTPYDAKKANQLELARKIMRKNRNMLKKLAE
jgi:putative addiction module antidote